MRLTAQLLIAGDADFTHPPARAADARETRNLPPSLVGLPTVVDSRANPIMVGNCRERPLQVSIGNVSEHFPSVALATGKCLNLVGIAAIAFDMQINQLAERARPPRPSHRS